MSTTDPPSGPPTRGRYGNVHQLATYARDVRHRSRLLHSHGDHNTNEIVTTAIIVAIGVLTLLDFVIQLTHPEFR
jgi:hypothetical protein